MRKASDLSKDELVQLVNQLLFDLYGTTAGRVEDREAVDRLPPDAPVINPDHVCSDEDVDAAREALAGFDLVPDQLSEWTEL